MLGFRVLGCKVLGLGAFVNGTVVNQMEKNMAIKLIPLFLGEFWVVNVSRL